MKTEAIFWAATLWFIVAIYFNMDSSALSSPFVDIVDFVGLLLFFLLAIYILIRIGRTLVREYPVEAKPGDNSR